MRLFLLQPATIFAARVNQSSFTYPLGECEFDTVTTGAFGDIKVGMTLLFGTAAGDDDLGRQRIRKVADSDTIFFGRSSQGVRDGEVKLQDNAYITVLDDYRVWAKIPYIDDDGNIFKDHDLVVGTLTDDIPPKANGGVGQLDTIDSVSSKITASWDASTKSFANSGSISSYLWDVDDGTITVGSTSTAAITVTFPAGFRWVHVTVTDSNGETHTHHMPVYARDPASDTTISAFNINSHRITQQGQQISFRIREAIAEGTYPDGTLVMISEYDPASAADRNNMLFIGWHQSDPATIASQRTGILQDTILDCVDVVGRLDTLPGFTQSVEGDDTPTEWTEMSSPNMDKYLHYLFHWHSTALDLADWTNSGTGSNFPFVVLGSDGESLWDQLQRRAKALVPDYVITCNTLGQMATTVDPFLQDTGDRTATVQASLSEADWTSIEYEHIRPPRIHWLRGDAILASSSAIAALFCVSPGSAPGQGEIEQTSSEQLAKSQSDLNAVEGHRYARLNAPEGIFNIVFAEGSDRAIEPANMTWIRMNISATTAAQRGLTLTNARGLVSELNITYDHTRTGLVKTVTMMWERETDGPPAETYIQPEDDIPEPEFTPPPPPTYDDNPGETPGDGFGTCYIFLTDKLVRTSDLSVTSPTWVDITDTISGTSYDWILDPWNLLTRGFALTSTGVWRVTGLDGSPSATQVLTQADVATGTGKNFTTFWYKIQASINVENYIVLFADVDATGGGLDHDLWCIYSEDAGDTWNYVYIDTSLYIGNNELRLGAGFDVVPHLISGDIRIYAVVRKWLIAATQRYSVWRSDNRGASWSLVRNIVWNEVHGNTSTTCVNTPYSGNANGNTVWVSLNAPVGTHGSRFLKSTDGMATYSQIALPGLSEGDTRSNVQRLGIEIYIENGNRVAYWAAANGLFKSLDGNTFTEVSYSGYVPGSHGNVSGAGGFPSESDQYYIVTDSRYVFVSIQGGTIWIEKTGNLQSVIGSNDPGVDGMEKGVIVPVWVAE